MAVFDRVTSEEATLLMAAYLEHKDHPPIAKTDLPSKLALTEPPTERPWPSEPLPGTVGRDVGQWVFANDKNAATHMIRNSLAGHRGPSDGAQSAREYGEAVSGRHDRCVSGLRSLLCKDRVRG